MSDLLSRISTGVVERPHSIVVFGPPGVGKSTFAASAPDPLFVDTDDRTAHLAVKRIKPASFDEILEIMRLVVKGDVTAKTLVVDTLDHAEMLLHKSLCDQHGVPSIEDVGGGYGKGYIAAVGLWRRFALGLEALRNKGVNTILLAHSHVRTFQNPLGENFDRWELKLDKRAHAFLREKVDAVGFADFESVTTKSKDGGKLAKAKGTGRTLLKFAPSPAYESKRFAAYPETCELDWSAVTGGGK
jgi:hypothetical protein